MDTCGTKARIAAQDEHWPFKMALFFLSLKKSSKILIISPQVPFWGSSTNHLPCHTLSKTLEISRILIFDKSMMYTKNNKVTKRIFVMLQRKHQPKTNDDRLKQLFDSAAKKVLKNINNFSGNIILAQLKNHSIMSYFFKSFRNIKKIPQTSIPISKALKITWLIERSWLMQEYPGPNPDWFEENKFFLKKIKYIALKQAFKYFTTNRFRDAFCVSEEFWNPFMLQFFHVPRFRVGIYSCCTISMLHLFFVALFSSCIIFMQLFLCCTHFMLQFFRVVFFPWCTPFVLHFLHVAQLSCFHFFELHFTSLY